MTWPTFPVQGSRLVSEFRGDFNDIIELMLSAFAGPTEPSPKYPGLFWVDTSVSPKLWKQRNSTNTVWIIRGRIDSDYGGALPLVGGQMEGGINMNGFPITNLPAGGGNSPARYTDLAGYAKLDGSIPFSGIPTLPALDPSSANQATRKDYVDRRAIAGGSFTGLITLPAAATDPAHATRKQDVDNAIATHTHTGAAAMGPKIPPDGLSASAGLDGDIHRIENGAVIWTPSNEITDGPGSSLINTGSTTGPTNLDLTSIVPRWARSAIFILDFTAQGASGGMDYVAINFFRYLSSSSIQYLGKTSIDAGGHIVTLNFRTLAIVPFNKNTPTQKIVKYSTTRVGGALEANVTAWFIGYL